METTPTTLHTTLAGGAGALGPELVVFAAYDVSKVLRVTSTRKTSTPGLRTTKNTLTVGPLVTASIGLAMHPLVSPRLISNS
ncbi:hypothetical protein HAX54_042139 [Datura stramonium]|uniref:Uncharacterized protein n=1 Tax=Datura stramonium TaxID=4076 RepID=A0ABS8VZ45_DATST|nr:hypothetical protein [Datura stramonium]